MCTVWSVGPFIQVVEGIVIKANFDLRCTRTKKTRIIRGPSMNPTQLLWFLNTLNWSDDAAERSSLWPYDH